MIIEKNQNYWRKVNRSCLRFAIGRLEMSSRVKNDTKKETAQASLNMESSLTFRYLNFEYIPLTGDRPATPQASPNRLDPAH